MNWSLGAGLEGKGVIVTGATGGIGRAVAVAFAEAGAKVLAVDLKEKEIEGLVNSLPGDGHAGLAADLLDLDSHTGIIEYAIKRLGNLYVLSHVAAVLRRKDDIDEVNEEDWDFQVDTNLKASFFLCRAAAKEMQKVGNGGRIIAFSSQGWWTGGFGGSVVYAASKGGIVSMIRGLARTYGPDRITVNSVAPGAVETSMARTDLTPEVEQMIINQTPLGRFADPEELGGVVVFLASQHASFITGATINVSGGWLMY